MTESGYEITRETPSAPRTGNSLLSTTNENIQVYLYRQIHQRDKPAGMYIVKTMRRNTKM